MQAIIFIQCFIIFLVLCTYSPKLYNYSGLRLVVEKLFPHTNDELNAGDYRKPSSFVPWFLSIYIVLFGIASNRYERATSSYEMQVATFQTQMASESRSIACANLHNIQKNKVPHKPDLFLIWNTLASLFTEEKYEMGQDMLIKTIETYKMNLNNCTLSKADLSFADLSGANLSGANLSGADLSRADLFRAELSRADLSYAELSRAYLSFADLSFADLSRADLSRAHLSFAHLSFAHFSRANLSFAYLSFAHLSRADLSGANLSFADLFRADLSGADLSGADLSETDLSEAKTLYKAKLPPEIGKELRKTHPKLFEKPDWLK